MGRYTLLTPGKPKTFGSCGLDGNAVIVNPHNPGQHMLHLGNERIQFRLLGTDSCIDIPDLVPCATDLLHDLREQFGRIGVLPLRIRIREMGADVPKRRRAEKRVDDRMDEDIRIRVSLEPRLTEKR